MGETIKLKNVRLIQRAIRAIAAFVPEGNFRFNSDGISFRAMDPSQIVMVNYNIPVKFFDKFNVEPNFVGIDLDEFNKVMKRALPNDSMTLNLNDSNVLVEFSNEIKRTFNLSLISVSGEEPDLPKQSFDAKIELKARVLQEALKDAILFGSSVIFNVKKGKFLIEAKGSQGNLNSEALPSKNVKISTKKDIKSKYSLNFLENIVKEANPDENIVLELKNESPMRIVYPIDGTSIEFYLAHMIL